MAISIAKLDGQNSVSVNNEQGIMPYTQNQWYWQYQGEPLLLRGGSDDDNLFQWESDKLTRQLDLLKSVGGNYLRNTMSDRDEDNVYAFKKVSKSKYDLNQWNEEYWNRLTFFLEETSKRGIIVQLTLWDVFDISSKSRWGLHPWNPENNKNMNPGTWNNSRDFFSTVNSHDENGLAFQEKYIDQLLAHTLNYDHVLYNINNESSELGEWENYWASYIKQKAAFKEREIYVTNMQLSASNAVRHVITYPELFDYADISQNNQDSKGARGQAHWDNLMFLRQKIASTGPFPMNNVKIYGSVDGINYSAGSETEAMDRFWRNVFGGCASSRFHRPAMPRAWGSGLNERVQTNLKAMDMLLEKLDIVTCSPHNDLLSANVMVPSMMQAYVTASIGKQYAIYFPQGRYTVNLDPWVYASKVEIQWLDINKLEWSDSKVIEVDWQGGKHDWGYQGIIKLETPSNRQCVAYIKIIE